MATSVDIKALAVRKWQKLGQLLLEEVQLVPAAKHPSIS